MAKRTLLDELCDPASWAGAPLGFAPPSDVYIQARLVGAYVRHGSLVIIVRTGHEQFSTALCSESLETLAPDQVVDMLTPYNGDLLLTALAHEIGTDD